MNFEKVGHNFAKIKSKSNNKKQDDIQIYLSSPEQEDEVEQIVPKIEIPTDEKDLIIQHLPFKDKIKGNSRQILYISGQSGSGKSYYTKSYVEEYIKLYPNNLIFLFSVLEEDETLDAIKKIKRVKLNDDFYNTMFSIDDFKNCLIIYDDCEAIKDKLMKEKLTNIQNLILTTGRHTGTSFILTTHLTLNNQSTKMILTETNSITLFLKTIGGRTLKTVLENYFGLSTKQINAIQSLKTRWITIFRSYPLLIMHEKGIYAI